MNCTCGDNTEKSRLMMLYSSSMWWNGPIYGENLWRMHNRHVSFSTPVHAVSEKLICLLNLMCSTQYSTDNWVCLSALYVAVACPFKLTASYSLLSNICYWPRRTLWKGHIFSADWTPTHTHKYTYTRTHGDTSFPLHYTLFTCPLPTHTNTHTHLSLLLWPRPDPFPAGCSDQPAI